MKTTRFKALAAGLLIAAMSAPADDGTTGWGAVVKAPELDPWIADAVAAAPALGIRRGNLDTARAMTDRARAAGRPSLAVEGDWRTGRGKDHRRDMETMTMEPFAGRARLEWELDLFGRVRSAVGAARYAEEAADWELTARKLTRAASMAQHYVQGRYLAEQLGLRHREVEAHRAIATYHANRAAAGLARQGEVDRARAAARNAEAREAATREQWDLLAAQWRYLAPTESVPPLAAHTGPLSGVPAPPPEAGLHAYALLRPDVRGAYVARQQADQLTVAAARDRKPSLTAIASAEGQAPSPVEDAEEWTAWAGVRLALPVLAPTRTADTRVARAQSRLSESLYNDAVSRAVLDLQESYARRILTERRWTRAQKAADLLKTQLATARQRRAKGLATVPETERAELAWLAAETEALALQAQTLHAHLSLIRACGGPQTSREGWGAPLNER